MARNAKFWLLYKRPGQRVLINDRGDMLVRPLYAELSMQQSPFLTSLSQVLSSLNMARICIYSSHCHSAVPAVAVGETLCCSNKTTSSQMTISSQRQELIRSPN